MRLTPQMYDYQDFGVQFCNCRPDAKEDCGAPATWHVIWTADGENGMSCDEHLAIVNRYGYFGLHRVEKPCNAEGSRYVPAEDRCIIPGEDTTLTLDAVLVEQVPA